MLPLVLYSGTWCLASYGLSLQHLCLDGLRRGTAIALFFQLLSRAELNNLSPEELQELEIAVAQKITSPA